MWLKPKPLEDPQEYGRPQNIANAQTKYFYDKPTSIHLNKIPDIYNQRKICQLKKRTFQRGSCLAAWSFILVILSLTFSKRLRKLDNESTRKSSEKPIKATRGSISNLKRFFWERSKYISFSRQKRLRPYWKLSAKLNLWIYSEIVFILILWLVLSHALSSIVLHVAFHRTYLFIDAKLANERIVGRPFLKASSRFESPVDYDDHGGARHLEMLTEDTPFPCRHDYFNIPDNIALISDIVLIGYLTVLEPRPSLPQSPLKLAIVFVKEIIKRPNRIIFPLKEGHSIRVGFFVANPVYEMQDQCYVHMNLNQTYILYLRKAQWSGVYMVAQIPSEYNHKSVRDIQMTLFDEQDPKLSLEVLPMTHGQKLEVLEGNTVTLICNVTGRPTPIITWYFNQLLIRPEWSKNHKSSKNQTQSMFMLENIKSREAGEYACEARNINGLITKSLQIAVKSKPTTPTPIRNPCDGYCINGECIIIEDVPKCNCPPSLRGKKCDQYYPLESGGLQYPQESTTVTNGLDRNPKKTTCKNDCDLLLGRVLLVSALSAILLILLILFLLFLYNHFKSKRSKSINSVNEGLKNSISHLGTTFEISPRSVSLTQINGNFIQVNLDYQHVTPPGMFHLTCNPLNSLNNYESATLLFRNAVVPLTTSPEHPRSPSARALSSDSTNATLQYYFRNPVSLDNEDMKIRAVIKHQDSAIKTGDLSCKNILDNSSGISSMSSFYPIGNQNTTFSAVSPDELRFASSKENLRVKATPNRVRSKRINLEDSHSSSVID